MSAAADPAFHDRPQVEVSHKGLLTVAVMAAMLMQILDQTIANVALPHMQATLGANQESISWVLTSYIVASAIGIPATGWLANRFGVRALFLCSVVLFVVASALCGAAANMPQMVLFRLLQGVGGAFIGPLAQSTMLDINRPSQHAKTLAIYGMGVMIGPIMGPILGGWLTDNFNWRWVFYINIPLGIAALVGLWLLLPRQPLQRTKFDLAGWLMIGVGIGAFQLMLDRGQHADWFSSNEIWIEAGIAISAIWIFIIHMRTTPNPLFSPAMLADRNLVSGTIFMFVMGMVMMSSMALLPGMLQTLFGYTVMDTGILLSSRGVGVLLTMAIAGRLVGRVDPRAIVFTGICAMVVSLWMMTGWTLGMDWRPVVTSGFLQGLGMGLIFVPVNVLAFSTLRPDLRTEAASLFNLARNIGASVGIAIVAAVLAHNIQVSHADLSALMTPYNLPMDPGQLESYGSVGQAGLVMLDGIINREAAMIAYLDDFKLMMFMSMVALPLIFFVRRPKGKPAEPVMMAE